MNLWYFSINNTQNYENNILNVSQLLFKTKYILS